MTILLRTLARKSVLDFGKYEGRSVQQVIDLKNIRLLRWYYYNCSMISFHTDILDEIGITEEWRIDKPGKDPEKGQQLDKKKDIAIAAYRKSVFENQDKKEMGKINQQKAYQRRRKEAKSIAFEAKDNRKFTKGNMAWKNQGH